MTELSLSRTSSIRQLTDKGKKEVNVVSKQERAKKHVGMRGWEVSVFRNRVKTQIRVVRAQPV